jgi:hypothetical protein
MFFTNSKKIRKDGHFWVGRGNVSRKTGRMVALNLANQLSFLLFLLTWTDRKCLLSFQFPARHKTNRSCPHLCNPLYLSDCSVFTYTNMCTVRRFGEIKQQSTRESDHYVERLFPHVGLHCPIVTASCRRMVHRLVPRCCAVSM